MLVSDEVHPSGWAEERLDIIFFVNEERIDGRGFISEDEEEEDMFEGTPIVCTSLDSKPMLVDTFQLVFLPDCLSCFSSSRKVEDEELAREDGMKFFTCTQRALWVRREVRAGEVRVLWRVITLWVSAERKRERGEPKEDSRRENIFLIAEEREEEFMGNRRGGIDGNERERDEDELDFREDERYVLLRYSRLSVSTD